MSSTNAPQVKKIAVTIGIIAIALVGLVLIMMFVRGEEDTWLNINGNWVKHGVPSAPPPNCAIENCHGLDIVCGPNPPDACTAVYKLGDFCRQFAQCEIVGSECEFAESHMFMGCKSCVEKCEQEADGQKAFECEDTCRQQYP
ncbi:hypothetical protein KKA15_01300 [Patescibacteria group bacterium]|nr:hypothetical protein [Patescibacteria group bacterium]